MKLNNGVSSLSIRDRAAEFLQSKHPSAEQEGAKVLRVMISWSPKGVRSIHIGEFHDYIPGRNV
jgi:hypothetical protein